LDLSTVIGIGAAFGLMIMAILQGGPLSIFVNVPSIMIVVGGTFGNTLVHYPFGDVFDALNVAKKTLLYKNTSINELIVQLMGFANKARKEGILALQGAMDDVEDDSCKKPCRWQSTVRSRRPSEQC